MDTPTSIGNFSTYYYPDQVYSKSLYFLCREGVGGTWESVWMCEMGRNDDRCQSIVLFDWEDRAREFTGSYAKLHSYSIQSVNDLDEIRRFFQVQLQRGAGYFFINPDPRDRPPKWERRRSIADVLSRLT